MYYTLVKPLGKTADRFLCALPSREWLTVGQYVTYAGERGDERVGVVAAPDFEANENDIRGVWNCPIYNLTSELRRIDIEWPEDTMQEPLPEIE